VLLAGESVALRPGAAATRTGCGSSERFAACVTGTASEDTVCAGTAATTVVVVVLGISRVSVGAMAFGAVRLPALAIGSA
jgi:hypothetical protein